jgi:uncharacterized tellurite resistance protein B-like protein
MGGHWLPVGSMSHVFASDAITISLCREIADMIESKGYCVEPDARFGNGTYDRNQTLALFKPLSGEAIKPSTTYLGATNLLRLCVLIATADGKLDLEELDVFRSAIEYKDGLSKTDHKRLIVLEQLLAQELCSASKAVARIAKSVSPENRLVIGKLLVEVAAVNQVITSGERRALEQIFKAFEIRSSTLKISSNGNGRVPNHVRMMFPKMTRGFGITGGQGIPTSLLTIIRWPKRRGILMIGKSSTLGGERYMSDLIRKHPPSQMKPAKLRAEEHGVKNLRMPEEISE